MLPSCRSERVLGDVIGIYSERHCCQAPRFGAASALPVEELKCKYLKKCLI